jgi:predicted transcriptional regulator
MSYFQRRTNFSEKEMTKLVDQLPKNSWKMKKTLFEKWQENLGKLQEENSELQEVNSELQEVKTRLLERLEKMEAKELQFVQSLVINTDFDDDKIVLLANVSLDLVKKIRKDLNAKS